LNNEFVEDRVLLRYTREVVWQAELGILGLVSAIAEAVTLPADPNTDEATILQIQRCWQALHSCVSAGASLSKLFWPLRRDAYARGDTLRSNLSVRDDSPLRSRAIRDGLEHFDERLDRYLAARPPRLRMDMVILPKADPGSDMFPVLRWFDPTALTLTVMEDRIELVPLVEEMERVKTAACALRVRLESRQT
jgi:hypothetical protein